MIEMTIQESLAHAGIYVQEADCMTWNGTTAKGKPFTLSKACGAYGLQFTLDIDGQDRITHCKLRTAVKKIKTS